MRGCGRKIGPFDCCTVIVGSCSDIMPRMPDGCVDQVVTSPPYWNLKVYSHWDTYEQYLADVNKWIESIARLLKPGRYCNWVVQDKIPWPPKANPTGERLYMPLYSDCERLAAKHGLIPEFPIIWDKRGPDLSEFPWPKKMWGSYPYPVSIIPTTFSETICRWRKPGAHGLSKEDRETSKITAQQFNEWAVGIWGIRKAESPHPAAFPPGLVERLVTLWSCKGDLIFDPFIGSGTTAIEAQRLSRHFFGCDTSPEYVALANRGLSTIQLPMGL